MATSTLAAMAPAVSARLQDPTDVFWSEQFEILAGLAEAVNELLLLIGRPTQVFNQQITLQPNTCFQPMPPGLLAITNMRIVSTQAILWQTTLRSLDYLQSSWSGAWQSDRAANPARWAPIGLGMFVVHPAPLQPVFVNVTGVAYPFTDSWPPTGTETSPFEKNINQALEMYAASYARLKEVGQDAQEGQALYQSFLNIAQRYADIQGRRDALVFSQIFGAPTGITNTTKR
jgi:hypothetical protein